MALEDYIIKTKKDIKRISEKYYLHLINPDFLKKFKINSRDINYIQYTEFKFFKNKNIKNAILEIIDHQIGDTFEYNNIHCKKTEWFKKTKFVMDEISFEVEENGVGKKNLKIWLIKGQVAHPIVNCINTRIVLNEKTYFENKKNK